MKKIEELKDQILPYEQEVKIKEELNKELSKPKGLRKWKSKRI